MGTGGSDSGSVVWSLSQGLAADTTHRNEFETHLRPQHEAWGSGGAVGFAPERAQGMSVREVAPRVSPGVPRVTSPPEVWARRLASSSCRLLRGSLHAGAEPLSVTAYVMLSGFRILNIFY